MKRRAVLTTMILLSAGCVGMSTSADDCPAIPREGTTVCQSDADLSLSLSPTPVERDGELAVTIRNDSERVFEYNEQDPYSIFEKRDSDWTAVAPDARRQAYSAQKVTNEAEFTVDLFKLKWTENSGEKSGTYVFCLTGRLLSSDESDSTLYHVLGKFNVD